MQSASLCFNKVKNDCVKFITSQETSTDKFKNKEKMIKSFLIPICFWIAKKANKKNLILLVQLGDKELAKLQLARSLKLYQKNISN